MRVPLFPLDLVLFPGQTLPLHVFETRYKQMLQRSLKDRIPFGIVAVRDRSRSSRGTPHSVGTLAVVTKVEEMEEGRCPIPAPHRGNCYQIVCRGTERFRVTSLDRREAEYLMGDIELYPDEEDPPPALAMVGQRVAMLFDEYYRQVIAIMGGWQRPTEQGTRTLLLDVGALLASQARLAESDDERPRAIPVPVLPEEPAIMSNVVAAELNVATDQKQELLETPSALARLQREAEILAEEMPQLEERLEIQHRRRYGAFGMTS